METSPSEAAAPQPAEKFSLIRLFDLRRDQAEAADIDADVRASVRVAGTNLWVLFFAILIASVSLNVNSTASIIGAMLISPLMGPIVGIGYGAGVRDFDLIRKAFRNLLIFAVLSLATSTLYFAVSPLNEAGSELLARTSPTIWDVLIALFGGTAGVIAMTRRSISNVVPGVAIATALMPPLCTAGFGLAHGRWEIFVGAFYLFLINGVFIATATLMVVRVLRLPFRQMMSDAARNRARAMIAVGLVAVLGPSVFMGWRLVQDEVFLSASRKVVATIKADDRYTVVDATPDPRERLLRLSVVGDRDDPNLLASAKALMEQHGLGRARLELRYPSDVSAKGQRVAATGGRSDAYTELLTQQLNEKQARIKELEAQFSQRNATNALASSLQAEIRAQVPSVTDVALSEGSQGVGKPAIPLVVIRTPSGLPTRERERLEKWLVVRLKTPDVLVVEQTNKAQRNRRS